MSRPPPDINDMTSLKVNNLTYRTSPETLRQVFEKYGRVGDVHIPRDPCTRENRGFAFVRFHYKCDAEEALDGMDGTVLDGRELRVEMAHVDHVEILTSLKVDNLTYRTSPDTLRVMFEMYGRVGDVHIPRDPYTKESKGFAFVRFHHKRDAEDAIDAMDGVMMDGRELRVQMAHGGGGGGGGRREGQPRRSGGHDRRNRRSENFTPSCSSRASSVADGHFLDDEAAGPSRLLWNEGRSLQFPDRFSPTPKRRKLMDPIGVEDDEKGLHNADITTVQPPRTPKSLVLLESLAVLAAENDILREENEELKRQLEKQRQTFFL
ncbi:serine/arginine-rich splicing factor 2b [Scomber scombrus]|uniref:serine/arginine-rich splicing factor 2b n=1 Tax=Scomber scombrus TaxID=13677 RepID=UPI002DD85EFD|nr:serine/arginine-rich splicing factor 2b [Scomber scombrus]